MLVSWSLALQWASGICMSEWEPVPPSGKNTIWHKRQWGSGLTIIHSVTWVDHMASEDIDFFLGRRRC